MSEKVVLKRQVYLSVEQYNTLKSTGSVTVDGKTINFSENDEYITPDTTGADITAVRQELLTEIQKKADTSYVNSKVEQIGTLSIYQVEFIGNNGDNEVNVFANIPVLGNGSAGDYLDNIGEDNTLYFPAVVSCLGGFYSGTIIIYGARIYCEYYDEEMHRSAEVAYVGEEILGE
jgi:hypothetical protein